MRAAIVKFSALQNRWDPEFYLGKDPAEAAQKKANLDTQIARLARQKEVIDAEEKLEKLRIQKMVDAGDVVIVAEGEHLCQKKTKKS